MGTMVSRLTPLKASELFVATLGWNGINNLFERFTLYPCELSRMFAHHPFT